MARKQTLTVVIAGDADHLNRVFSKVSSGAASMETKIGRASTGIQRGLATTGKIAAVALGAGLVGALKKSVDAYAEAEGIAKQTNTVIASTAGVANVSAKAVAGLATEISRKSGIDDEAIQSAENLLLTFTKVRNETGKGNDIFNQATQTVADFSVRFKKDLGPSAILVGKALQDPIKGTAALSRVGVQFTKGQKAQISTLVESGKTLDAQKLILGELEKQTRGAADAAGNTFAGKINKAKVAVGNLGEAIGGHVAPVIGDLADKTAGFVNTLATSDRPAKFFGGVKRLAGDARDEIAGIFKSIGDKRAGGASLGKAIGDTFADAVSDINWRGIGRTIATGVGGAIRVGGDITKQVQAGVGAALSHVDGKKLLSGLLRVVGEAISAAFSPSFWYHNFSSIVTVALAAFPIGKILKALKIPGGALLEALGRPIYTAIRAVGGRALRLLGEVAGAAIKGFLSELGKAPGVPGAALRFVKKVGAGIAGLPKAFAQNARYAAAALAQGLVDGAGAAGKAAARVLGRITIAVVAGAAAIFADGVDLGVRLVGGIVSGVKSVVGSIGSAISKGVGVAADALTGKGDGIGRQLGKATLGFQTGAIAGAVGGGGLMGANPALGPAVTLGAASGLHTTSGKRAAGSLTSSNNPSYHGYGEAVDQAGPPNAMMRYFQAAKQRFKGLGARFAELIYTPGGIGVKNGQPFRYTGQVAADHYDHVHTAFDLGQPGPGIGDGYGAAAGARVPGTGDGIGESARAGRAAGFEGATLVNMLTIAGRESGYRHDAHNYDPPRDDSYGDLQINVLPNANPRFKSWKLTNPFVNWKAGRILYNAAGYRPWKGPSGSWRDGLSSAMFAAARRAVMATRGSSASDRPGPASKPETRGGVAYPTGKPGKIIGRPGEGTHSRSEGPNNWQSDNAIDIAVPVGTTAIAVVDGQITKVTIKPSGGGRFAGSSVTLQGRSNTYFYAHLSEVAVKAGQRVKQGDVIGHTGSANGVAHLHFGEQKGDPQKLIGLAPLGTGGAGASARSASSASDRTAAEEKAGSRVVAQVGRPFFRDTPGTRTVGSGGGVSIAGKAAGQAGRSIGRITNARRGITSLTRFERDRARVIEEKDTSYAQADRRFSQSEEDLGTARGREQRASELSELKKLRMAQLSREKKRLQALKALVKKYDGLITALHRSLKGKKAGTRARIREKIKQYEEKRDEFVAEARSLGSQIEDTKLDIGDLDKEAAQVAATPDTAAADTGGGGGDGTPSPADGIASLLSDQDLQEHAGLITAEDAKARKIAILQAALAGRFGVLDERQQWELMGQLRDVIGEQVQASSDLVRALQDVKASIDAQLAFAGQVSAITSFEAVRAVADMITGELGPRVTARTRMPGNGNVGRLGSGVL